MNAPSPAVPGLSALSPALRAFILVAGIVTVVRVAALIASPVNLHFDEAQYWAWSRTLDWGYFSKPPLIAWAIAATTGLFGNAEAAVRLAAPLSHGLGALALFLLGRRLYGPWAGFWAGTSWLILPGVALSAAVISTDALMLPIWAWALFMLFRFLETPGWRTAAALGALVGLGALAKYAMLYFVLCAGLAALWVPALRRRLLSSDGLVAVGAGLLVLGPNLAWNAANDFATVGHTAANANLGGALFNVGEMLDFVFSQAGVIGPVFFAALAFLLWRGARRHAALTPTDKILIAFILPPLLLITGQALLSRAHANWAAAAYPAATLWLVGSLSAGALWERRTLIAATAVNGLASLAFLSFTVFPAFADAAGMGGAFKRARGWDAVCAATQTRLSQSTEPYTAVLVDHRALFFALSYYCGPDRTSAPIPPLRMWLLRDEAANHAAMTAPMRTEDGGHVLIVSMGEGYVALAHEDFQQAAFLGEAIIPLGGDETRWIGFSEARGFAPVIRDEAFEARIASEPPRPLPPISALPPL